MKKLAYIIIALIFIILQTGCRKKEDKKKLESYRVQCRNNDALACHDIGIYYMRKEPVDAVQYMEKGCKLGLSIACYSLGYLYQTGTGAFKDEKKAIAFFNKACSKGHLLGCYNVASLTLFGKGVKKDPVKANQLYAEVCNYKRFVACIHKAAKAQSREKRLKKEYLVKTLCKKGFNMSCFSLGLSYYNGIGAKKDINKAIEFFKIACNQKYKTACNALREIKNKTSKK